MEPNTAFDENFDNVLHYAKEYAGEHYSPGLEIVLTTAFSDVRNLPKLKFPKKDGEVFLPVPLKEYVPKLVNCYLRGYTMRPSARKAKPSGTHADPAIGLAFVTRVKNIPDEDLKKVIAGHSLQMSIENIIGDMLEEYLSERLGEAGWYCCWGSSIDAVDFCNANGELLQIKNSDNSENSSSKKVRNNTEIKKWARRKSTKGDTFYWEKLRQLTGVENISEEDFRNFIMNTIEVNPACIYVDNEAQYSK